MDDRTLGEGKDAKRTGDREAAREKDLIERREALIDESLEETFPASDPPSIAMPEC